MLKWLNKVTGLVLDIGSGDQKWKTFIPISATYLPLDYPLAALSCPWRETYPQIYADALSLPIKNECIDVGSRQTRLLWGPADTNFGDRSRWNPRIQLAQIALFKWR